MKYLVLQTIWHEGQKRHALPGELVELDHLTETQLEKLISVNVILPEEQGRGRFSRTLSTAQPALPPEVVEQAKVQAEQEAANNPATAQPEPAKPKRSRAKKG